MLAWVCCQNTGLDIVQGEYDTNHVVENHLNDLNHLNFKGLKTSYLFFLANAS